jgi:uncharacterized protein YkwD
MMNWLDATIIMIILFFVVKGLQRGFLLGLVGLVGIAVVVSIPLLFYIPASRVLEYLGISQIYSSALGFLALFFLATSLYYAIGEKFYRRVPYQVRGSRVNKILGLFTGLFKGLMVVTLLLAIVVSLPLPFITPEDLNESDIASPMLDVAAAATSLTARIFGEAFQHAVGFLTIEIDTIESVELKFAVADPVIDQDAEMEMLRLLNAERTQRGLPELVMDETLREVARQHSVDMFQRGYFGHVDPEGTTPFDRMLAGGVSFLIAGENLAIAPTVNIAHKGLMDSPGHRENILRSQFLRVGIGAARGGSYGTMFTQKFTN